MGRFSVLGWLAAGILGGLSFWLFQVWTTGYTIPQFMGQQIATQGGYPAGAAPLIGWGVHLWVSLSYALLFTVLAALLPARSVGARLGIGLLLAAILGWLTTLLTAPAITVTISLLARQGFPAELPGLNTDIGLPLYNHLLFFGVVWLVTILRPVWRRQS
jgi:hypothetical protein